MLSINAFELADLVQKFRSVSFSSVTESQAKAWMRGEMMLLPEDERDLIADEAWKEHLIMAAR